MATYRFEKDALSEDVDREWLEGLWVAHADKLFAYAVRRVGRSQAEEVVADVFVVAWRHRSRRPKRELPWLYGVARRVVGERYRSNQRWERLVQRAASSKTSHVGNPGEQLVLWDSILGQLNESDREALLLTVWEGLEPADAAKVVGISGPAFRMRLSRARRRLRELLADEGEKAEPKGRRDHE